MIDTNIEIKNNHLSYHELILKITQTLLDEREIQDKSNVNNILQNTATIIDTMNFALKFNNPKINQLIMDWFLHNLITLFKQADYDFNQAISSNKFLSYHTENISIYLLANMALLKQLIKDYQLQFSALLNIYHQPLDDPYCNSTSNISFLHLLINEMNNSINNKNNIYLISAVLQLAAGYYNNKVIELPFSCYYQLITYNTDVIKKNTAHSTINPSLISITVSNEQDIDKLVSYILTNKINTTNIIINNNIKDKIMESVTKLSLLPQTNTIKHTINTLNKLLKNTK